MREGYNRNEVVKLEALQRESRLNNTVVQDCQIADRIETAQSRGKFLFLEILE